ncbi:MAG: Transcription elongation factor GreA [Phycisphaerae bacterium]|nr:Transcription elongation factor GreA [Phycisphaerae bacterium]
MGVSAAEALGKVQTGDLRGAEDALLRAIDNREENLTRWTPVLEGLVRVKKEQFDETIAWALLEALEQRLGSAAALQPSGEVLRLFSKNEAFRTHAEKLYRAAYPEATGLEQLLDISGLRGGKPIRRALQTLDLCLQLAPDDYLVPKGDGAAVQVQAIDSQSWNVRLRTSHGEELFDPVTLGDQYERTVADDFRILKQFYPEQLAGKLNSEPENIILSLLRSHQGRITSDQLEMLLTPSPLSATEWPKWWTRARTALKKNHQVRFDGRNPVTVTYDTTEPAIEDEVWPKFEPHSDPKSWLDLGTEYLRLCKERQQPAKNAFLHKLRDAARVEAAALEKAGHARTLSAWITVNELAILAGEAPDNQPLIRLLQHASSIRAACYYLEADYCWKRALDCLRQLHPDTWLEDYANLLPVAPPAWADELSATLRRERPELLKGITTTILSDPITYLNGLCWLYNGPKDTTGLEPPQLATLLSRLMGVLDQVQTSTTIKVAQARDIRQKVRNVVSLRKYQRFIECLDQIQPDMADSFKTSIQRTTGLTDAQKSDLLTLLRRTFPKLWMTDTVEVLPWQDTNIIFCTRQGYRQRESELSEIVNVKMKENAIAIGEAAARGDLSENSEYKFALEERDLLRARMAEIQNQLAIAQVMDRKDVPTDRVSIGCRVDLESLNGAPPLQLTFLGPWEADLSRFILNYQAPLSQKLMGAELGSTVEIDFNGQKGEYRVMTIACAID